MSEATTREGAWVLLQGVEPPAPGDRVIIDGVQVVFVALEALLVDGVARFSVTTRPVTDAD